MASWVITHNPKNDVNVATYTLVLGAAKRRWTPVVDFIPKGVDFTIVSNTGAVTTSGSVSESVYVLPYGTALLAGTNTGVQVQKYLRDTSTNVNSPAQGTSFNNLNATARVRPRVGSRLFGAGAGQPGGTVGGGGALFTISTLQAAVESTGKTISFAIIY